MGGAGFEEVFKSLVMGLKKTVRVTRYYNSSDIDLEDIVNGKEFIATFRLSSGKEQTVNITLSSGVRPVIKYVMAEWAGSTPIGPW